MKVVYVSLSPEVAGGNVSLLSLVNGLATEIEAAVVAPKRGAFSRLCESRRIACYVPPGSEVELARPIRSARTLLWWLAFLHRQKPDLIHINDAYSSRVLAWQAKRLGIPVVCHCRLGFSEGYLKWVFRRVPPPSAVICNSHALKASITDAWRKVAPDVPQCVIHNGIDVASYVFREPSEKRCAPPYRLSILGRLQPVKGIADFIRMTAVLLGRGIPVSCRIVGGESHEAPGYRQKLEDLTRELGLERVIDFVGHQTDVRPSLYQSDLMVCASHHETFGRVLAEAMACGTAVVGTAVGGIPEVVEHETTGLLVPPADPVALANAVERMITNDTLRQQYIRNARARVEEMFSEEQHCERVLQLYQQTLAAKRCRA